MKSHQVQRLPAATKAVHEFIINTFAEDRKRKKEDPQHKTMDIQTIAHLGELNLRDHFFPRIFKETAEIATGQALNNIQKAGQAS